MEQQNRSNQKRSRVFAGAALAVAVVLYFVGTMDSQYSTDTGIPESPKFQGDPKAVATLRSYPELRDTPMFWVVNSWLKDVEKLEANRPPRRDLGDPGLTVEEKSRMRKAVIARRSENRAFDGAPPTIPHPVIQTGVPDCLVCHERGLIIRGRVAPKISHRILQNCFQCHTNQERQQPARKTPLSDSLISWENSFEGITPPLFGERAWSIAPPVIPHSTLMRTNCDSCHGVLGDAALRTPHTNRANCPQCHVSEAANNQRASRFPTQ